MDPIEYYSNCHKIHKALFKFGQWDIPKEHSLYASVKWKCTVCEKIMEIGVCIDFAHKIAEHILSHRCNDPPIHTPNTNHDAVYSRFMRSLISVRETHNDGDYNAKIKLWGEIGERAILYDNEYRYVPYEYIRFHMMDSVTDECAFCGFEYIYTPTEEMIIEHAAMCFGAMHVVSTDGDSRCSS